MQLAVSLVMYSMKAKEDEEEVVLLTTLEWRWLFPGVNLTYL